MGSYICCQGMPSCLQSQGNGYCCQGMLHNKVMLDLNQDRYNWSVVGFHNYNKANGLAANQKANGYVQKSKIKSNFVRIGKWMLCCSKAVHDYCNDPIS